MAYHHVLVPFFMGVQFGATVASEGYVAPTTLGVGTLSSNGRDKAAGRTHTTAPIPARPTTVRQHADEEWTGRDTSTTIISGGFKPQGGSVADPFGFAATQIKTVATKAYAAVQEKVAKNIVTSINKTHSPSQWEGWA